MLGHSRQFPAGGLRLAAPSADCRAAWSTLLIVRVISWLAEADSATFRATDSAAVDDCATLRAISWVAVLCSSTAEAIDRDSWLTCSTTLVILPTDWTAWLLEFWMASIHLRISTVAVPVCLANSLTSVATTAKPLPAPPARAASIVAFNASSLVCSAISWMTSMTLSIWSAAVPNSPISELLADTS